MQFGKVAGIDKPISRLVQGTATFERGDEKERMYDLLDMALALGINTFDTAYVYGPVKEGLIGQWVRDRGVRDKIVMLAKGAHHGADRNRVTPEDIESDMLESMERLQMEHLDMYVLHRDDPDVPAGPIVEALNEHVRAGRIAAFGGSNWSHDRIREANEYAAERGLIPFAVSSPQFSLAEQVREPWKGCISIGGPKGQKARHHYETVRDKVALFTWSSLAGGFFSGRYSRQTATEGGDETYFSKLCLQSYGSDANFERLDRAQELGKRKGCTASTVALAYVLSQPLEIFPLIFCDNENQFAENIAALDLELTPGELAWLDLCGDSPAAA